jgi:predicted nucleotidyltransferase
MKNQDILKTLRVLKPKAKKNYKAEIKGVFGSYARGELHGSSDVDVLVHFEDSADLIDFVGLSQFLEEKLKSKVDIVPQGDIREELKESILKDTIYL